MTACPNCGGSQFSTTIDTWVNAPGVSDGRLKSNEVRPVVVVGCDECSETIEVIQADDPRVRITVEAEGSK